MKVKYIPSSRENKASATKKIEKPKAEEKVVKTFTPVVKIKAPVVEVEEDK